MSLSRPSFGKYAKAERSNQFTYRVQMLEVRISGYWELTLTRVMLETEPKDFIHFLNRTRHILMMW